MLPMILGFLRLLLLFGVTLLGAGVMLISSPRIWNTVRGVIRLVVSLIVTVLGTITVIILTPFPVRIRGVRLAAWPITIVGYLAMWLFDIRFRCPTPEDFYRHHGFVMANHTSYFDIMMLMRIIPMRFLAKAEIRKWFLVGPVAEAIGTIFVKRESKDSRAEARVQLADAERYPPIVIFPEGRTGPGGSLLPFRLGAFEIAIQEAIPILVCAIIYDRIDVVAWRSRPFLQAFWHLASRPGPIYAYLIPLIVLEPTPDDDPLTIATRAHRIMAETLEVPSQM